MLLTVGRVLRPHGVRGEVVVEVRTDEPQQRYAVGASLLTELPAGGDDRTVGAPQGGRGALPPVLTVAAVRPHQGRLIVAFQGVADRTAAETLRGVVLRVDSETLAAPADPEEYHDHELVGLAAVAPDGDPLGEVTGVDHAPAADLLVVSRPDGRTALVPFVGAIVTDVDLPGRRVVIDAPAGLLDL